MPDFVFVVTACRGEYSDFQFEIIAAFIDEDHAKHAVTLLGRKRDEINEKRERNDICVSIYQWHFSYETFELGDGPLSKWIEDELSDEWGW